MSLQHAIAAPIPTTSRGPGIRMMFLGFFGTWWTIAGCLGFSGGSMPVVAAALIGLSIFLGGLYLSYSSVQLRHEEQPSEAWQPARARAFRNINIAQWVAIAALNVALNVIGHTEWLFPGIMMIVGLHFFPLARLFSASKANNFTIGLALVTVAALYPFVTAGGPQSPLGPLGAGLMLWTSALVTLASVIRSRSILA